MEAIVLDSTTDTIEAVLAGAVSANQPEYTVHYADHTTSAFTEGSVGGVLNDATDVTILAAPAASTQRVVKEISIYNKDTAAVTLTVKLDFNGTERIIWKGSVAAGKTWTLSRFLDEMESLADDTTPQLGGDLNLNDKNIALKFEPTDDDAAQGLYTTVTVDTNAEGIGAPLFMAADGHFDTADADASITAPAVVLAMETGTGSKKVLLHGIMRNDGWNWTTGPGKASLIYVSCTVGTLTQTQPSATDDVVQPVGWALSDDCIYFCPSLIYFTHA